MKAPRRPCDICGRTMAIVAYGLCGGCHGAIRRLVSSDEWRYDPEPTARLGGQSRERFHSTHLRVIPMAGLPPRYPDRILVDRIVGDGLRPYREWTD